MSIEDLPTKEDFVVYGDLDEETACNNLMGQTPKQVRNLLRADFMRYQEDFMFMGPVAFCFYLESMIEHVRVSYDEEEAKVFHQLCEYRLDDKLALRMQPCASLVATSLEWVSTKLSDEGEVEVVRRTAARYRALSQLQRM